MSTSKHIGRKFHKLTVTAVAEVRRTPKGAYIQVMDTECDCGNTRQVTLTSLTSGQAKSCKQCARPMYKHTTSHPLYRVWASMRNRCRDENHSYFKRGIKVCDRWDGDGSLQYFNNFVGDMGTRPEGKSLDRIDNNGPYSPENCRWADRITQQNNRSNNLRVTYNGVTKTWADWARHFNVSYNRLDYPRKLGHTPEEIIEMYHVREELSIRGNMRWRPESGEEE